MSRPLTIPELSLVMLIGPSGAGKSTFAARHFGPWEVLSSDHYRGVLTNDPGALHVNTEVFDTLALLAERRLARGLLTVIDATNVRREDRARWVKLSRRYHVLPVAVVLDVPPDVAHGRNQDRPDRSFGRQVVRGQCRQLRRSLRGLRREGFRYVHHLDGVAAIEQATVDRPRPWTDRRDERGPFDLIGDIHGCCDELDALLERLGYRLRREDHDGVPRFTAVHPEGRRLVFLGDLVDRGPRVDDVLERVMDLVQHGRHLCVPGNHEVKLAKWLGGRQVKTNHGLQQSIDQLQARPEAFRQRVAAFIDGLVSHFVLDDGQLVVAHAGMREDLAGRASGAVRRFALWGETTGEIDAYGLPVRAAWAEDYRGRAAVVYGHTPVVRPEWVHDTLCIDTGCVFGGSLTALRWPERELVSVPAARVYCAPTRPPAPEPVDVAASPGPFADLPDVADVFERSRVETRFRTTVRVPVEQGAAALEVLARFAAHPRWLVHLPPTMSPCATSARDDLLEHPDEAFAYYRDHGLAEVVCEHKHMGSRALVIVGRTPEALAARFGSDPADGAGVVLSRRGRRFFTDGQGGSEAEAALVDRVRRAFEAEDLWQELGTDWALLDAELMPWSAKARSLLQQQYAPVGQAARRTAVATEALLARAEARGVLADDPALRTLVEEAGHRRDDAVAYTAAYRRYCWEVARPDQLRLAPFHLLATEGAVHTDRDHPWHMALFERLARHDEVLMATRWRRVRLDDPAEVAEAVAWWEAHTAAGGEGMVVKPVSFLATDRKGRWLQPAIKCRGRDYLRIIYGPEYLRHLPQLRQRAVRRKRSLARRELVLGLEALHRFVEGRPQREVMACVQGILALEAEPIDPRL